MPSCHLVPLHCCPDLYWAGFCPAGRGVEAVLCVHCIDFFIQTTQRNVVPDDRRGSKPPNLSRCIISQFCGWNLSYLPFWARLAFRFYRCSTSVKKINNTKADYILPSYGRSKGAFDVAQRSCRHAKVKRRSLWCLWSQKEEFNKKLKHYLAERP